MKPIKTIFLFVLFLDAGQLLLKLGVNNTRFEFSNLVSFFINIFLTPYVIIGFSLIAVSSILWLSILSKSELSFAYPMISIGYVIVSLASIYLFNEQINLIRWLGIFTICTGVFLMSRS